MHSVSVSNGLKVFKNNKWCYENKQEAIEDMIDKNYYMLDDHYEYKGKEELSDFEKERYMEFQFSKPPLALSTLVQ